MTPTAAAGLPALRARRRRFQRPAAQRVARDPAGIKDIDTIRAGCTKKVLGLLEDLAENQKDKYAPSGRNSAAC
jgi:hypothetical protein